MQVGGKFSTLELAKKLSAREQTKTDIRISLMICSTVGLSTGGETSVTASCCADPLFYRSIASHPLPRLLSSRRVEKFSPDTFPVLRSAGNLGPDTFPARHRSPPSHSNTAPFILHPAPTGTKFISSCPSYFGIGKSGIRRLSSKP